MGINSSYGNKWDGAMPQIVVGSGGGILPTLDVLKAAGAKKASN